VTTTVKDGEVQLRWEEVGGPEIAGPPTETGFGTMLSELSIVQQLGGTITREWRSDGLAVVAVVALGRLVR
jgi:two-component sensor histidine kinase